MSIVDLARQAFGRQINTDTREALFRCSSCGRDRLYVNTNSGAFYCVRCEYKGNLLRLCKGMDVVNFIDPEPIRIVMPPDLNEINAVPIHSRSLLFYLRERGFTEQQIYDMKIRESSHVGPIHLRVCNENGEVVDVSRKWINLQGAVIFPIYDNGYRGYQARYIYATDKGKRWLSAPGVRRKTLIYNADTAFHENNDRVFVAEGIPAACAFGRLGLHAVATFGKGYSNEQVERMCGAPQQHFFIAYDGDAQADAHRLGCLLEEAGKHVRIVPMTGTEDPDSVPDLATRIRHAVPANPYFTADLTQEFHTNYRRQQARRLSGVICNETTRFSRRGWR